MASQNTQNVTIQPYHNQASLTVFFLPSRPHSAANAVHQPAVIEAQRGRDQEKGMVAVLEIIDYKIILEENHGGRIKSN
jgi:hypothetical protein